MMDIVVDFEQTIKDLTEVERQQVPFALARTLNRVSTTARDQVKASLDQHFTIAPQRKPFMQRLVRFDRKDWATKQNPAATIRINQGEVGEGNKDRSFLLGRHEEGGEREAADPLRPFFIPDRELRPGQFDLVPRSLYPTALRLMEGRGIVSYTVGANGKKKGVHGTLRIQSKLTTRGKLQIQGKRRTFIIDGRQTGHPDVWGIYQRTGPKPDDVRLLWALKMRIHLPPRLHFYDTVGQVVEHDVDAFFAEELARALETAR